MFLLASQDLTRSRAGLALFLVAVAAWDRGIGLHVEVLEAITNLDVEVGVSAGVEVDRKEEKEQLVESW